MADGVIITETHLPITTLPADWQPVGMGDFDGNGGPDLMWRNQTTGGVGMQLMDGAGVLETNVVETIPLHWRMLGVGDCDGDGKADLLWRNQNSGQVTMQLMDGPTILQTEVNVTTLPMEWWMPDR